MELTSPVWPWVFGGGAGVVLVLLALGVPRVKRRPLAVGVRALQATVMNLLVIACCGVVLNNQYAFYTSWTDLTTPDNTVAQTVSRGSAEGANRPMLAVVHAAKTLPALPAPGQREQEYRVTGAKSGVTGSVIVRLPAGYDPTSDKPYPVLIMLSGYPGAPRGNYHAFSLNGSWDRDIRAAGLRAPIVVMPQINTPSNTVDTECINDPTGRLPQTETWLATDIPQWVAGHFRVSESRQSWATIGFSYGGWCSAQLAMLHPDTFGGSVAIMGYYQPQFNRGSYSPLPSRPDLARRYNLTHLASTAPPPISMLVMSSRDDLHAYGPQLKFVSNVRAPMSITSIVLASGGHRVDVIPPQLPRIMKWMHSNLSGFRS